MKLKYSLNRNNLIFLLILAGGTILRFWDYASFSLSNDELSALWRTRFESFNELVNDGFYVDGHPGGIQVLLFYWVKLFGDSVASIRFPFVILSVLAIVFAYATARRWVGEASALLITACIAFLEFPLLYSQIARPYGPGLSFTLMTAYYWTKLVMDEDPSNLSKWKFAALYTLGNVLMMYTHYFSSLMALIMGVTGLFLIRKNVLKPYIIAGCTSALLFLPHVGISLNHLSIGGVGAWLGKPGYDWIIEHIYYVFNQSSWVLGAVIVISVLGFIAVPGHKNMLRYRFIAIIWFLLPILTGFIYSHLVNPVLQHSVVIFSFPFLLLFLFSFPGLDRLRMPYFLIPGFTILLVLSTVIEKKYYGSQHFGEFKDIATRITHWESEFGRNNVTIAVSVNNEFYLNYYLSKLNNKPSFVHTNNRLSGSDLLSLHREVKNATTPYFIYAWTKAVPYETNALICHYYPNVVRSINYGGLSEITLYSKIGGEGTQPARPSLSFFNDFETSQLWGINSSCLDTIQPHSGRYCIHLGPGDPYGPTFQSAAGDVKVSKGAVVHMKAMVRTSLPDSKAVMVFSLEQWEQPPYIWRPSSVSNFVIDDGWNPVFLSYPVEELKSPRDILKVYLWNQNGENIWIDDISVVIEQYVDSENH